FACAKPWLTHWITRASGNSVVTSSAVPSVEELSATTTSRVHAPRCSKTLVRHARNHRASFVDTTITARSFITRMCLTHKLSSNQLGGRFVDSIERVLGADPFHEIADASLEFDIGFESEELL